MNAGLFFVLYSVWLACSIALMALADRIAGHRNGGVR